MRARGAKVTDIAVLVVAADDSVMPQTLESISHARAADVPIVVAVNKIDLPGANPDRVLAELATQGLQPEEWGGTTQVAQGLREAGREPRRAAREDPARRRPRARPDARTRPPRRRARSSSRASTSAAARSRRCSSTAARSRSATRSSPATPGAACARSTTTAARRSTPRARASRSRSSASTSRRRPASSAASSRTTAARASSHSSAASACGARRSRSRPAAASRSRSCSSRCRRAASPTSTSSSRPTCRARSRRSSASSQKIDHSEVRVNVIHTGVGGITENDVNLAAASSAMVVGFNVRPSTEARQLAERQGIEIRQYRVIYELTQQIEQALVGMLSPVETEAVIGEVEVRALFQASRVGTIAGCMVTSGIVRRGSRVRIFRDGARIHETSVAQLKRFKDDAREVVRGLRVRHPARGLQRPTRRRHLRGLRDARGRAHVARRAARRPRSRAAVPGFVAILSAELHFPEAGSLKGKRKHVLSAKAQLQNRFGASVAEVDHHELWQRCALTRGVQRPRGARRPRISPSAPSSGSPARTGCSSRSERCSCRRRTGERSRRSS